MLVIIEGLDKTGKSTLAEALAKYMGEARVVHSSAPKEHPLVEYQASIGSYKPADGRVSLVLDRWHVGERVWPEIFGRASVFDLPMYRHVEMFLQSRGAVTIFARRDSEKLKYELEDEPIGPEDIDLADELFCRAFEEAAQDAVMYDYERDWDYLSLMVTEAHQRQSAARKIHEVTSEWIGNPRPDVLLVGEMFGPSKNECAAVPFVPYRGTSGHFLMEELGDVAWWDNCAVVNAYSAGGNPMPLNALHKRFQPRRTIALGRISESECRRQGIAHAAVPHPQYVRRFERSRGKGYYAELLTEAAR